MQRKLQGLKGAWTGLKGFTGPKQTQRNVNGQKEAGQKADWVGGGGGAEKKNENMTLCYHYSKHIACGIAVTSLACFRAVFQP